MSENKLHEVAENMAEAIREWNRAKLERESWKPVVGQVPPVGILGSAKKANAMLSKALEEYEAFQQSVRLTCATCGAINAFEYDEERLGEICVRCGTRR